MRIFGAITSFSALLPVLSIGQEKLSTIPQPSPRHAPALNKESVAQQISRKELDFAVPADWSLPFYPQGTLDAITSFQIKGDSIIATGKIGSRADSTRTWGLEVWDGSRWNSPVTRPGLRGVFWGFLQENSGKIFFGPYASEPAVPEMQPMASWDGAAWRTRDLPGTQPNNGIVGFASAVTRWNGDLIYATWLDGIWKIGDTSVLPFLLPDKNAADPSGKKDVNVVDMTVRDGKLWVMGRILGNAFAFHDGQKWTYPGMPTTGGISWAFMGQGGFFLDGGIGTRAGVSVNEKVRVLQWDGADWKQIALDPAMRYPRHLATDGQSLFLIGYDRYVEVIPGGSLQGKGLWISKWDGSGFKIAERADFTGLVMQATYDRGRLFLGGGFNYVGELRTDNLAMWDGSRWHAFTQGLRPGLAGGAGTALSWKGKLVFGGKAIVAAGDKRASGIAAWDGTGFETFGSGIPALITEPVAPEIATDVACLAGMGESLYAGGTFDSAGTRAAKNVARWDGAEWAALGDGLPGPVSRLLVAENTLYALSLDTNEDPRGLAKLPFEWTGSHWDRMGKTSAGGFGALADFQGSLWSCSGADVLRWRGTEWDTVPMKDYGRILDLVPYRNELLISADNGLFRFDGLSTDTLAEVENASLLVADGDDLYAHGLLKIPGYPEVNLARWDGVRWHPMGYFGNAIKGMVIHGDFLYVFLNQSTEYWDFADYNLYLRWNRKTGTWSRPMARKDVRGVFWKALPCAQDCFFARGEAASVGYDLKGRILGAHTGARSGAAGVRVLQTGR